MKNYLRRESQIEVFNTTKNSAGFATMNWKLFGGFGVLISVILALSLGLTLPKKNADPDQDTETHTFTSKIYYLGLDGQKVVVRVKQTFMKVRLSVYVPYLHWN